MLADEGTAIPVDTIRTWTDAQLKFMVKWVSVKNVSEIQHRTFGSFIKSITPFLPLTEASRLNINVEARARRAGTTVEIANPEGPVWRKGGDVFYNEKEMIVRKGNGEIVVTPNRIIPTIIPFKRPGIQSMAVLLSAFVKIQRGQVQPAVAPERFVLRWTSTTVFDKDRVDVVHSAFRQVFQQDPACEVLRDDETRTKEAVVRELCNILSNMDESLYYYLHTRIVYEFLAPYKKTRKLTSKSKVVYSKSLVVDANDKPLVPESSYQLVAVDDSLKEIAAACKQEGYPCICLYKGGLPPTIRIISSDGIDGALASRAAAAETRGSDKTGGSFLSAHIGYSGLSTEIVRTLQRGVAMIGGVLDAVTTPVDIFPGSIGNLDIIYASLRYHYKDRTDWRFVVEMSQMLNIKPSLKEWCRTSPRHDAHCVKFIPLNICNVKAISGKTSEAETREILKKYQEHSSSWAMAEYSSYTIFTSLYGSYPWQAVETKSETSATTALSNSRSFIPQKPLKQPHYVYHFGMADQFYGIVSTIPDLTLFGALAKVEKRTEKTRKWNEIVLERTTVTLKRVDTEAAWYALVRKDNAIRESYWCAAKVQFSPISNVLKIPKSGVTFDYKDGLEDAQITVQDYYDPEEGLNESRGRNQIAEDDESEDDEVDVVPDDEGGDWDDDDVVDVPLAKPQAKKAVEKRGRSKTPARKKPRNARDQVASDDDENVDDDDAGKGLSLDELQKKESS
jgi:hypothetical protein